MLHSIVNQRKSIHLVMVALLVSFMGCRPTQKTLEPVSYGDFEKFVQATAYVTDAERYGWSIVQQNVFDFEKMDGANWRIPDGKNKVVNKKLPVTQVSYNDAKAYCNWAGNKLPTYEEYWNFVENDVRPMVYNNNAPISPIDQVNILGNVWDITEPLEANQVRLSGGSLFCSKTTCHGMDKSRKLIVDSETSNVHIGFCVIKEF